MTADQNPLADKAKAVTAVVQALLWSLFTILLLVFLFSQSAREYVAQMAEDANLKSVGPKGVEFQEKVAKESLQLIKEIADLRMTVNALPRNQDVKPGPASVALLTTLQEAKPELAKKEDFWVYVGEYDEQKHSFRSPPNFDVKSPPSVNETITASQNVYERDVKPYKDSNGVWQLGSIKGVLPQGKSVSVLEFAKIEGENQYDFNSWVRAKPQ
jgi:hypothetical protein